MNGSLAGACREIAPDALGHLADRGFAGDRSDQVIAFARTRGNHAAISVTSRFTTRFANQLKRPLGQVWEKTALQMPAALASWRCENILTGEVLQPSQAGQLPLAEVFAHLPVAILDVRPAAPAGE